jgi:hypothetical protein
VLVTTKTPRATTNTEKFVSVAIHENGSHCSSLYSAAAGDETLAKALNAYHRKNLSSNKKISARLWADHAIKIRYVGYESQVHKVLTGMLIVMQ